MDAVSVVVIGAGPAGLALSGSLVAAGVDHVVLERHDVGHAWRHQRWDSLRTLTPNWMNGLPRLPYRGPDPDGYMTATELADRLDGYASSVAGPVVTGVEVSAIRPRHRGHLVEADVGSWAADAVVLATGPGETDIPAVAADLPCSLRQVSAAGYRNPGQLGDRVLVVGASASGVQIADEVLRSGRSVTLAVGEHVRLPRTYRGRDILWWMQAMGVSSRRWDDDLADLTRARHVPSPQLIGAPDRTLDLRTLRQQGVQLVGRLGGLRDHRLQFSGSLANLVANADLKQARLLDQIDEFIVDVGVAALGPDGALGDREPVRAAPARPRPPRSTRQDPPRRRAPPDAGLLRHRVAVPAPAQLHVPQRHRARRRRALDRDPPAPRPRRRGCLRRPACASGILGACSTGSRTQS